VTDLATLANLAEIFGATVVVGGVIFAMLQIRQFQRQRLEAAAMELIRAWQSPEFTRAFTLIQSLPDDLSAAELRAHDADSESLAMVIGNTFESIGVMVYRRIVPLAIVNELMGGAAVHLWRKLERWTLDSRAEQARDSVYEWCQWLTERLQELPDFQTGPPAHVARRDWKP
jgi:hypothetical protein